MGFETTGTGTPSREAETGVITGSGSARRFEVGPVTEGELQSNLEKLHTNFSRIKDIPENVLNSQEGQAETSSLKGKINSKIQGFTKGMLEKFSKLDSIGEDFIKYAGGSVLLMATAPALGQYLRSQHPEIGVMLDAAPDVVQQIIHFDAWAQIINLFSDTDKLIDSIWKGGGAEVSNMLADLSSGKLDSLTAEQTDSLRDSIGTWADLIKSAADKGDAEEVKAMAENSSSIAILGKAFFSNGPVFLGTAMLAGWISNKVGSLSSSKLQKMNSNP